MVCLGAGIVCGEDSANFVNILDQRLAKNGYEFINEGVNGDLSYNMLGRLDAVVAHNPAFVVILVGTNDVTGVFSPRVGVSMRNIKSCRIRERLRKT